MKHLIQVLLMNEFTAIKLFSLIKIGVLHLENDTGKVYGIMLGLWRFETQFVLGFNHSNQKEMIYHA